MKWEELQEQQQQEWEEFSIRKDRAWQKIKQDNEAILTSFGGKISEVPESTIAVMESRGEKWAKEWGVDGEQKKLLENKQRIERRDFIRASRTEFISHAKKSIERQRQEREDERNKTKDKNNRRIKSWDYER
jgi:hypothetical protein